MSSSFHLSSLSQVDPQTAALAAAEERRQREKIILIPSESLTPAAVRDALGSAFSSVYAEGYPRAATMRQTQAEIADIEAQLSFYRRYADRRFYKGTEFADLVESLAARRAAECFATPDYPPERIYANVQALSGAAANLAVYDAFVKPGETVMGMALTEGGHLTHGSEFNVTGKRYRIVSYRADPKTGKLDYGEILRLAKETRPRMIIGGFTSFPWQADWAKFREIADEVGAILLADVAHTAGLIVGGVYPNPIGHADVVSFTTHKTLCGPRGAVLLTTDAEVAARIDSAIFPGQQGGPHVNKFAAIAVALSIAQTPPFKDLQRRIVENALSLAEALRREGLTLAYGGTDTHLLVVDLSTLKSDTGYPLMGEIAARILDLADIVTNKNTLPGDHSAADARGIRLGSPWVTQRGMGREEMESLARTIARVLREIRPFTYPGLAGPLPRGKLPIAVLTKAREEVRDLLGRVDPCLRTAAATAAAQTGTKPWTILRLRDGRVRALLQQAVPSDLSSLKVGEARRTFVFDGEGKSISEVVLGRIGEAEYLLLAPRERGSAVRSWICGLADGYTLFDTDDLFRKVEGPAVVEEIAATDVPESARSWLGMKRPEATSGLSIQDVHRREPDLFAAGKPYFVGQNKLSLPQGERGRPLLAWKDVEGAPKRTPLYDEHKTLGAKLVPFAGWEMPVWYASALEEHRAIRQGAGLFDLGHMGVFEVAGPSATEFLNVMTTNYPAWLEDGQSHYAHLLDPDGNVVDDIWVYRRAADRYLVVVNAANEDKDWAWLNAANDGEVLIDREIPSRRLPGRASLRNLKAQRGVVDVALQGPASPRILAKIVGRKEQLTLAALRRTEFCEMLVEGHQMLVARTGYTGEEHGYEIFLDTASAQWLWATLLEVGKPLGLKPCGLASRDSTRTEAGLPLYGHDLAGSHRVNPFESGFGSYVKLHKPFFVGRKACVEAYRSPKREIVRFEVAVPGARPVRPGAAVADRAGTVLGHVTSCVSLGETQVGMALLDQVGLPIGTPLSLLNPPHGKAEAQKAVTDLSSGDRVNLPISATSAARFPPKRSLAVPEPGAE
jgi:glycine hydroxymethyltransferase